MTGVKSKKLFTPNNHTMAKLKMLKLPKKPKKNASIKTKEAFLQKVAAIKNENSRRKSINDHASRLDEKISKISGVDVTPGHRSPGAGTTRRKKKSAPKKKTAKKRRR